MFKYLKPKAIILPILALVALSFAIYNIVGSKPDNSSTNPPVQPLASPAVSDNQHVSIIAGTGLIEPVSENIAIGSHLSGIVAHVFIHEGQMVNKGQALFVLDDHAAKTEVSVRQAALSTAKIALADARSQLAFYQRIKDKAAISKEALTNRQFAVKKAQAMYKETKANLTNVQTHLHLHTVYAPTDAQVLQINIRTGEFAQAGQQGDPIMLLGDTRKLNARIDIDEFDLSQLHQHPVAIISPKGNEKVKLHGRFIRLQPFIKPKRTLSGNPQELVDTRVAQLIFRIEEKKPPVFSGQQVDAYIESDPKAPLISTYTLPQKGAH